MEPVFGIIHLRAAGHGAKIPTLRGRAKVAAEWTMLATAFNLRTLWRAWRSRTRPQGAGDCVNSQFSTYRSVLTRIIGSALEILALLRIDLQPPSHGGLAFRWRIPQSLISLEQMASRSTPTARLCLCASPVGALGWGQAPALQTCPPHALHSGPVSGYGAGFRKHDEYGGKLGRVAASLWPAHCPSRAPSSSPDREDRPTRSRSARSIRGQPHGPSGRT